MGGQQDTRLSQRVPPSPVLGLPPRFSDPGKLTLAFLAVTEAPRRTSSSATSKWPQLRASCRGVMPSQPGPPGSSNAAPRSSSSRTISGGQEKTAVRMRGGSTCTPGEALSSSPSPPPPTHPGARGCKPRAAGSSRSNHGGSGGAPRKEEGDTHGLRSPPPLQKHPWVPRDPPSQRGGSPLVPSPTCLRKSWTRRRSPSMQARCRGVSPRSFRRFHCQHGEGGHDGDPQGCTPTPGGPPPPLFGGVGGRGDPPYPSWWVSGGDPASLTLLIRRRPGTLLL